MEKIEVWFDKEADLLEIFFERKIGYFKETEHDAVMKRVDMKGKVIGFLVTGVSSLKKPISVCL